MVRAIALLGILLVHCMQSFHAFHPEPEHLIFPQWLNKLSMIFVGEIIQSKSFMVFSFLFGMSFFLQMDHARERGIDYRARFCWRLLLLFGIGFLHSLFYRGDILTTFAVVGLLPVFFWNKPTWLVAVFAFISLAQPLALASQVFHHTEWSDALIYHAPKISYAHDSLPDILTWNLHHSMLSEWSWNLLSGRFFSIVGMFLTGMLAGRSRIFEGDKQRLIKVSLLGLLLFVTCGTVRLTGISIPAWIPFSWFSHLSYVIFFVPFIAWVFSHPELPKWLTKPLSSVGRCTLTCYVTQGIFLSAFFCDWGLGVHMETTSRLLFGLLFFIFQMLCCTWWMQYFKYGPMEGVWRSLTRIGLKK